MSVTAWSREFTCMELRPLLEPAFQVSVMGSGRAPGESKPGGEQGAPALRNIDKLWGWPPAPNPAGPTLHSQLHLLHRKMHRMGGGLVQWSLPRWCRVLVGAYKDSDITMVTSQASPPIRAKGGAQLLFSPERPEPCIRRWPALPCLHLPGAPGSSAAWPSVSWGQVSPELIATSIESKVLDCCF